MTNNCEIRSTRNKLISDIKDIITILPKTHSKNISIEQIENIVRDKTKRWVKK
jgi:hypothetical protein